MWLAVSYYTLIKDASDVVIIKVVRIEGQQYGEKAIGYVQRTLKGTIQSDSIELPFVYRSWPTEKGMVTTSDIVPVSFEVGKRYVALLQKWHPRSSFGDPRTAETEYEVLNYPKRTFFEIADDEDPRLLETEQLLKIADDPDPGAGIDSLISMIHSNKKEMRIDAIEALTDIRTEDAARPFISVLRNDPDPSVRYSAALGLGYLHSDTVVSALMECLQKESAKNVRYQIIGSLGMLRAKAAAPVLLGLYETEGYDIRNAILTTISQLRDSAAVPSLIHFFSVDRDMQHRHLMAQTIASFHTFEADEFSTTLLDTTSSYWLKSAIIDGWGESGYTKGFGRIVRWASIPFDTVMRKSKSTAGIQGLVIQALHAISKLGTPEQVASILKAYSSCDDSGVRQMAFLVLRELLAKDITPELREKIEEEIKTFPSEGQ
jgi:hypothetical protein